jgi:hypothetical protein
MKDTELRTALKDARILTKRYDGTWHAYERERLEQQTRDILAALIRHLGLKVKIAPIETVSIEPVLSGTVDIVASAKSGHK